MEYHIRGRISPDKAIQLEEFKNFIKDPEIVLKDQSDKYSFSLDGKTDLDYVSFLDNMALTFYNMSMEDYSIDHVGFGNDLPQIDCFSYIVRRMSILRDEEKIKEPEDTIEI